MKVIFLDFDGVLNSTRTYLAREKIISSSKVQQRFLTHGEIDSGFDIVAVGLLRRLVDKLGAVIVISSSWRYSMSIEMIRRMFTNEFEWEDADDVIIGMTPRSNTGRRGEEIQNWIDNKTVGISNFQYVIIDDSSDMEDHQFDRFVKTDYDEGLSYKDYNKVRELFGDTSMELL